MAETHYPYTLPAWDGEQLDAEIHTLALPGFLGVVGSAAGPEAVFSAALSVAQESLLDSKVLAHIPDPLATTKRMRAAAAAALGAADDRVEMVIRAVVVVIAKRFQAYDAVVAAATSLTDLKARWAALPAASVSNVRTAITTEIAAGSADT